MHRTRILITAVTILGFAVSCVTADARGGGRGSMGHFGGGGGRPSMGGGGRSMPRPQMSRPQVSRPQMSRPSSPSIGHASRPSMPARPSGGGFSPSGGGRPSINRPSYPGGGGLANRPSIQPPTNFRPASRPAAGGGDRPTIGGGGNRPGAGGGGIERPIAGGGNRPTIGGGGNRPTIGGGGNRPGAGGGGIERPIAGGGNRPGGGGNRPTIGGGGNRPNRPGGNTNIGNNVNINTGNQIGGGNFNGNRPNWDRNNWNRPGWGWGNGGWAGNWHNHCINNHYGWYNGCWSGYWGSNWYAPLAWGAVGWGLGSLTSGWGYGAAYSNPYYVADTSAPYDYSQPVTVNNYAADAAPPAEDGTVQQTPQDSAAQQATKLFDDGLAQFKSGNYQGALTTFDAALAKLPGDPVVHEVRALTLFALGQYQQAAAALNSFLSSAPGMDWTTLSSLYGNTADYQAQLRKLEQFCRANPQDPASAFVLAYQYLVLGAKDDAIAALRAVVREQPRDSTAKRMLDALAPPPASAGVAGTPPAPGPADGAPQSPTTDLVGNWRAKSGDTTIELAITADSAFTWKAVQQGKPPVALAGQIASTSDELVLESKDQGSMNGSVKSLGPNEWQFALSGAPPSAPGLTFARVN